MIEFECECTLDVNLLNGGEGVIEQSCLVNMFLEFRPIKAGFNSSDFLHVVKVSTLRNWGRGDSGEAVRPVVYFAFVNTVFHGTVTVEIHDGADGAIDG